MDIKDLEEIKQLLAKNGYKVTIEKAIDWSNVKYVKRVAIGNSYDGTVLGKIKRLPKPFTPGQPYIPFNYSSAYFLEVYAPATKEEIETHLQSKVKEFYGEFKVGDKLDRSDLDVSLDSTIDKIQVSDIERGVWYDNIYDKLYLGKLTLYKNGVWAKLINGWKGVKYAKCVGDDLIGVKKYDIVKLVEPGNIDRQYAFWVKDLTKPREYRQDGFFPGKVNYNRLDFIPATKEEIEAHLRKEAVERFGTIKLGDNFIMADGREFLPFFDLSRTWLYNEESDELWFHDLLVYREGKWAERVPQKVKVIYAGTKVDQQDKSTVVGFSFRLANIDSKLIEYHNYLQSKLEEYLNKK
jgi:hypothetical protein